MAASSKKMYQVFVAKIPWTVATREMKEYFGQFGPVKNCTMPFDRETGFHKGFCWVGFSSEEGMNNALQKEPHIIEGSKLQVQKNQRPFTQKSNMTKKEFESE
ncbi:SRA stem-loop-interacting RNA-binding protein, mitochondrial-like [Nerophis lumbriciformis]|uniref:SRA stem-loop-interacting RNA-binding protein, mitochondrial-like n=1 Tax=Nerophis lumbriciformis TaxID=546530 RepID=UPI002AE03762|nr:SRA stem-loop-interacting RNA-binding protein, mitochondrial-like [Nerophis lumbriciformis]XP_061785527.1 SRA stem-loop-interacting RNA-binding protein, mitochondrial-like [Nerophis lumbriciformis]